MNLRSRRRGATSSSVSVARAEATLSTRGDRRYADGQGAFTEDELIPSISRDEGNPDLRKIFPLGMVCPASQNQTPPDTGSSCLIPSSPLEPNTHIFIVHFS